MGAVSSFRLLSSPVLSALLPRRLVLAPAPALAAKGKSPAAEKTLGVRQDAPADGCKATKEDLLGDGLKSYQGCPICQEDYGVLCRVVNHPTRVPARTSGKP